MSKGTIFDYGLVAFTIICMRFGMFLATSMKTRKNIAIAWFVGAVVFFGYLYLTSMYHHAAR